MGVKKADGCFRRFFILLESFAEGTILTEGVAQLVIGEAIANIGGHWGGEDFCQGAFLNIA